MTTSEQYRGLTIIYVTGAFSVEAQVKTGRGGRLWHLDSYGENKDAARARVERAIDNFLGSPHSYPE